MTSLATQPTLAVPKRETVVTFTLTGAGANYLRAWCTVAPEGSELAADILKAESSNARITVYEGDGGANDPWRRKFDKGGRYTIVVQEYTKGTGFGGGYQGDTRANLEEAKVGSETTLYVDIGQRFEYTVGTGQDTAKLIMWVWNDSVQSTTVAVHGEKSPAIVSASSQRALTASRDSAVTTALGNLAGNTVGNIVGSPSNVSLDITIEFNLHLSAGPHSSNDADNKIKTEYSGTPNAQNLTTFVTEALKRIRQHFTNDYGGTEGGVVGIGSANGATTSLGTAPNPYHVVATVNVSDLTNLPLVRTVSTIEEAYAALADLWRCYEAHRINTDVHASVDTGHALSALPKLMIVHKAFFAALAATSPTAAPGDSSGAAILKLWGAKET